MQGQFLWVGEFYYVFEKSPLTPRGHHYVYEALQFKRGSELPREEQVGGGL
jgi:hypothetical protein